MDGRDYAQLLAEGLFQVAVIGFVLGALSISALYGLYVLFSHITISWT